MIKVLFVIHDLCGGGAEKVLVNLVNYMDKTKFDITVLTLFDVGINKQYLNPDVKYKTCFKHMIRGNSHLMKLLSPRRLYEWLIKDEYDIVVSYLEGPSARIVSGCPYKDTKKIAWIHGEQRTKKAASIGFRSYEEAKKCYHRFDRIICVSQTVLENIKELFDIKDNLMVLYNTNETGVIIEKAKERVEDISFDKNTLNICSVGRLIPVKGYDRLINVHKRLVEDGYGIHTYILGTGKDETKLRQRLEQLNLLDSFTLVGFRTNPYKYVKECGLFVCSSYTEGFSTAATEALIVGTPVLTTLCSGMEEMLGKSEYGCIVENSEEGLYQGIKELLDYKEKLNHYKEQAKIRGEFFSTDITVCAVEDMLKGVLEQ